MNGTRAVIDTDGLTKRYGTGEGSVLAVDDLDLRVGAGEVFGFLGPNGAGKSTTINMLLDFVRPSAGAATVLGMDAQRDAAALRARVGVLPEGFGLYGRLSGRRHLELAVGWMDADDDPDRLLERVGLAAGDAGRPVGDYSTGMRRRLALGMALAGDPDLLVLDEPSAGLDPLGIRRMRDLVREEADRGTTVFFSSHVLSEVEAVCDRVGILAAGELVAVDTVEGLRRAVGAGAELRLRVDGAADADLAAVEAVEGVESVVLANGILRVACSASRAKARVVARLANAGVDVVDVDSAAASLEDVFTAYTADGRPPDADGRGFDADRLESDGGRGSDGTDGSDDADGSDPAAVEGVSP